MPADVVGVSDVLGAEREQRVAGPPRQFTEAVVDALEAALQIGLEDADRRAVVHDSQALRTHPQRFRVLFDRVDIDEGDDGALDVVFGGAVGADAQRVPPSRSVLHIALERLHALQHSGQNDVEIGHVHVELDVGQRPADVGGDQVEHRLRHRREAPDPQIGAEHDDRHLHAGEQVHQVDRKSTRLNSSHGYISYAVFCLKKKKITNIMNRPYNYPSPRLNMHALQIPLMFTISGDLMTTHTLAARHTRYHCLGDHHDGA